MQDGEMRPNPYAVGDLVRVSDFYSMHYGKHGEVVGTAGQQCSVRMDDGTYHLTANRLTYVGLECGYCACAAWEQHAGFCLTRMEGAREQWRVVN